MIIGHRGAPRDFPENTLPAFLRALELGADGIELDVHETRDGVVVVHHDPVPHAVAADGRPVRTRIDAMTFDALQGLAIGGSALVPTLDEVLAAVHGRSAVFIEIKGAGIERAVVDLIHASPAPDRCAVHAAGPAVVQSIRQLDPAIRTGLLVEEAIEDAAAVMERCGVGDLWPRRDLVTADLVGAVHAAGGRVIAWTVNRASEGAALAELGVDGLCTDSVPAMQKAIAGAEAAS